MYGKTSGTLHGAGADRARSAELYGEVLAAARELLVPLPGRAARVLQLAALQEPGEAEARELAGWADPRAEAYFFHSGPAPLWWGVLAEHAPHLLLPDRSAGGRWPAAPFLEHVAGTDPDAVRAWLAAPDDQEPALTRAQRVAAAGRPALDALLGLALRHGDIVGAAAVRAVLADTAAVRAGGGPAAGATLRLAARWARTVPRAGRTRDWVIAVEDEHAGHLSLRAVAERVAAAETAAKEQAAAGDPAGAQAAMAAALAHEEKLKEQITEDAAARLPGSEAAVLLRELAVTAYPAGRGNPAHQDVAMIRAVLAGLLARDVALLPAASRPLVFGGDLPLVHAGDPATYGGPRLARTLLDLAAADADAGVALGVRTRAARRLAAVDAPLHDRLMAAHLAARPPAPAAGSSPAPAGAEDDAGEVNEWWEQAIELTPRLVAAKAAPEPARLAALVFGACPPEHAGELETRVRTVLGAPPTAAELEKVLPAGADRVDGTKEPLASWLRVWDWSPLLPARVLAGWEPVLERVRRLKPAGPADPRTVPAPVPVTATTALTAEDLAEPAEARGPAAAAAELAAAPDAGDGGYAMVLHHLIAAAPAAWTADVPAILDALKLPELGALHLAAAAGHADRPGAFPGGALAGAVTAALGLVRTLDRPATADHPAAAGRADGRLFADQALFDLLTTAWRTDTALDAGQEQEALARLHALAAALARPAPDNTARTGQAGADPAAPAGPDPLAGNPGGPALLGSDPRVRALGCLLEYAVHQARARGQMPTEVLQAVAGALPAAAAQDTVATAIGVRLPALHHYAPDFTAVHRTALYRIPSPGPSPAASWLRWGPPSPPLLAALDRADLIGALRGAHGLAREAAGHTAAALLTNPALLGEPAAWWEQLAGTDGDETAAAAVSCLLEAIALSTPRTGAARALPPAEQARVDAAVDLWRAALAAGLPAGALARGGRVRRRGCRRAGVAGADALQRRALPGPATRRPRRRTRRRPPRQPRRPAAHRAAGHPRARDMDGPGCTRARPRLLDAAAALPAAERPAAWQGVRRALVNAGDVDAARHQ
ncbi:hypothetical protein [Streptomyces mutabilis]|uniref:hypothetical protein n=1 Tax=Streptomyces mutabilis TaxID=67332 RepID=UPI000AC9F023|nr:hypothetical protein [Streptomyces mutabilis]